MKEFKEVLNKEEWSDKVYKFLQVVFRLRPEKEFFYKIKKASLENKSDEEIHSLLQANLNDKFHYSLTYSLPALRVQKEVIFTQMKELIANKEISSYLEFGTLGRYGSLLVKEYKIKNFHLLNETEPSYSPADMMERGSLRKKGKFYKFSGSWQQPSNSYDLISCIGGLHHLKPEDLPSFLQALSLSLKSGGLFIVREHDCQTPEMKSFVSLIHTIFNLGTNVSVEENKKEIRNFKSAQEWVALLKQYNLEWTGKALAQENDPSDNLLMSFKKV